MMDVIGHRVENPTVGGTEPDQEDNVEKDQESKPPIENPSSDVVSKPKLSLNPYHKNPTETRDVASDQVSGL